MEKLQLEVKAVDVYDKPFDGDVLSDERLGIPEEVVVDTAELEAQQP